MKKAILVALAALVLISCFAPSELLRSLVWGWLLFLLHTLPRMTMDWPSVFVGCLALLLFTVGIHAVGRMWRRNAAAGPRWRFRWSLALVLLVFVLFAAGISLVGIVHQAGWLATSPERYHVRTIRPAPFGVSANSRNNLKQIGLAMGNYTDVYGSLPLGGSFTPDGRMLHSWETHSLTFIGYSITDIDFKLPWNHPHNDKNFKSIVPVFLNDSLPAPAVLDGQGFGLSHYAANSRLLTANRSLRLADLADGTANTLLVGEVNAQFKPWGHPVNWRDPARGINRSPHGFGGAPHAGGANFSMADGSVRFVSERIHPDVLRALSTPAGGEKIDTSVLGSSD